MYRLTTLRAAPRLASLQTTRSFSIATRKMAEGDTGAPRSGGAAQGDAFSKREQASEDYYVRKQEREKLEQLKKRIAAQEQQLQEDKKAAEELEKQK